MRKLFVKSTALALACLTFAGSCAFAADEPIAEEPVKAAVFGDINGDGAASNADLVFLAKAMVGLEEVTGKKFVDADINKDGLVSNSDVVILAKSLTGIDVTESLEYATDVIPHEMYDRIYAPDRLAQNSKPGQIVIELKKSVKATDYEKLFPELEIDSISASTYPELRTLLLINLVDESKENAINAVLALKDSPYVYQVYPNYIIVFDWQ